MMDANLFDEIIAKMPGTVYWKNRKGIYLGCNDNGLALMGLKSRQDVIGKNVYQLVPKKYADLIAQLDEKVMSQNKEICLEEAGIDIDGNTATYLTRKVPLRDGKGKVVGMFGISFDITARKKIEENLKEAQDELEAAQREFVAQMAYLGELISAFPGEVYWKKADGIFLGCNDNFARRLNLVSRSALIGKTIYAFQTKEEADRITAKERRIIRQDKAETLEETVLDQQGEVIAHLTRKAPLHDEKGEVVGLIGIAIDITEKKRLERAWMEAKEAAEQAGQLKTEFIRNMEHDIRTPFNGVWGVANLLWQNEAEPEKKALLADIRDCAHELLNYCNNILDFSKIEFGSPPLLAKKFDVQKLLESIIAIEMPPAKLKKLRLNLQIDRKIPPVLVGDPYRLQKILINLLSNAIKFTEEGVVTLRAKLIKKSRTREVFIRFIIEDTGIGIPPEKQNLIYEKFTRLVPANRELYKGLGLGLRIVKQFVEEMAGEIELKSMPCLGSTFVVTLAFKLPLVGDILE